MVRTWSPPKVAKQGPVAPPLGHTRGDVVAVSSGKAWVMVPRIMDDQPSGPFQTTVAVQPGDRVVMAVMDRDESDMVIVGVIR